jgi:UDP-N-acetylglucosamine--N-acetylmuramyl-(pentapeptide) pyrophosphoryl-undecaprenol N-acetylglucosamine transferase
MGHFDSRIPVTTIHAGKLRRYHTLSLWQQLLRPRSILLPNLRDMVLVVLGFIESFVRLFVWRPDVVFTKGGFVCLPVGLAARVLRIPLVIHDSDAHPGLTNRILAKWATMIATGAPLHFYPYPKEKSYYTGIPIAPEFKPFTPEEQAAAKREFGFDDSRPLLVVTGGGLGAKRLNDAVVASLDQLLDVTSVLLISGAGQYDELKERVPQGGPRFQLKAFVSEGMARVLGGADIVVARAGATTIVELAALAKPTILVPNAYLTGGHQLKNAAVYAENEAVLVLDEQYLERQPAALPIAVSALLADTGKLQQMQERFHTYAKPQAAADMADMVIRAAKQA